MSPLFSENDTLNKINTLAVINILEPVTKKLIIKNHLLAKMRADRALIVKAIKESDTYLTMWELFGKVKNFVEVTEFVAQLSLLESTGKIIYDGGKILWTAADNPKLKKLLKDSVRVR